VAGLPTTFPALSVESSRVWHAGNITDGNLIFGFAGDLSPGEAEELVLRHFGAVPEGPSRAMAVSDPAGVGAGLSLCLVDKPERTQSQILIGQHAPRWGEPTWLPLRVATTAFGGIFTARLMDEVRVKRGLSYGASARTGAGCGRPALSVHVFPAAHQTGETLELVLRLYREWARDGLRPEEVEFARGYLARSFAFRTETPESRLSLRTELLLCGMPPDYPQTFPARAQAVTEEEVRAAMDAWLRPDDLVVTLTGTADTLGDQLDAALGPAQRRIVPYDSY
jgi:zinc protease